jgi:lipoic acid synthetase
MLGLGEYENEVLETMIDLRNAGCIILTVGQYLQPGLNHMKVLDYISPGKFEEYRKKAMEIGFSHVECNPLVRSSFHAEKYIWAG